MWELTVLVSASVFVWCVVGAPLCLLLMWLLFPPLRAIRAGFVKLANARKEFAGMMNQDQEPPVPVHCKPTIESMLREGRAGVGAENLHYFLDNPMDDEDVRQDEKGKSTTVEHIKLLRKRLEGSLKRTLKAELETFRERIQEERPGAA